MGRSFTPGPWFADKYKVWGRRGAVGVGAPAPRYFYKIADAELHHPWKYEEQLANARLIAAAPELLRLAKAYEEWEGRVLMEDQAWQTEDGLPHLTQELWDELGQLQAQRNEAIAKAEGDS